MRVDLLVADMASRLTRVAQPETARWFNNYLKGAIEYRGVKSPMVRDITKAWGDENGVSELARSDQFAVATALAAQPFAEDKFAAIFWLQSMGDCVDVVDQWFSAGHIYDWSTTDWLCVRVLDPLVLEGHTEIAEWRFKPNLWQRRAAIVSLRGAVAKGVELELVEQTIADLLPSDERFIHTGIGWVLADWSKRDAEAATRLFDKHINDLSLEVVQRHTKHLPKTTQKRLLGAKNEPKSKKRRK